VAAVKPPVAGDAIRVDPDWMHASVPTTLQEANPKAGSVFGRNAGDADRRRERSPEVDAANSSIGRSRAIDDPDENYSGRKSDANDTWARTGRNAERNECRACVTFSRRTYTASPPGCGNKPAKGKNPMSAAWRAEGRTLDKPGCVCIGAVWYAARRKASANDGHRATELKRWRSTWTDRSRACGPVSPIPPSRRDQTTTGAAGSTFSRRPWTAKKRTKHLSRKSATSSLIASNPPKRKTAWAIAATVRRAGLGGENAEAGSFRGWFPRNSATRPVSAEGDETS